MWFIILECFTTDLLFLIILRITNCTVNQNESCPPFCHGLNEELFVWLWPKRIEPKYTWSHWNCFSVWFLEEEEKNLARELEFNARLDISSNYSNVDSWDYLVSFFFFLKQSMSINKKELNKVRYWIVKLKDKSFWFCHFDLTLHFSVKIRSNNE